MIAVIRELKPPIFDAKCNNQILNDQKISGALSLHNCDHIPIETTADGNCLFHALSICLCGAQWWSEALRVSSAYILLEYRDGSLKLTENSREGNQPGNIDYDTFIA
jgi:hypothetical protein